jgi:putative flippase GtrA
MMFFLGDRFIKFGLVGLSGVVIDFSVTWICKEQFRCNKFLSNAAGFCCAVISNFLLNRCWTFHGNTLPVTGQFTKFLLVSVSGLLINNLILYGLMKYLKRNFYFLKLVVIGLVFFWNYFANFLFTFN